MKRLRHYLGMIKDSHNTTYRYKTFENGKLVQKEIYDGECSVVYLKPNGELDREFPQTRRDSVFWQNGISYALERTNKRALDRPTIIASIPAEMLGIGEFTKAAADYCLRRIKPYFDAVNALYENKRLPDSTTGKFYLHSPGGEVLVRNAAYFAARPAKDYRNGSGNTVYVCEYDDPLPDRMCLNVRIEIQLPHGKIERTKELLLRHLPDSCESFADGFDSAGNGAALRLEKKQGAIREYLHGSCYCAFIANGSLLARNVSTGLPLEGSVPFESPREDLIEIAGVAGMGLKRGVTVITGGGYSGKSTLLDAVAAGIYDHAEGDGRELCLTDASAATITAEDGRAVSHLNISPFIKWLPGSDPGDFSSDGASGSTSQAANIMEAVDSGARLLLIDEDRSATNFMIRDRLMTELIEKEPIVPFTSRVRELACAGVSTVLVIGGSGEYIGVADKIYMMDEFKIFDATDNAKALMKSINRKANGGEPCASFRVSRRMTGEGFTSYPDGSGTEKLCVSDTGFVIFGDERVDVRGLHDLATGAQIYALAFMLRYLAQKVDDGGELEKLALSMRGIKKAGAIGRIDIKKEADDLYARIEREGIDFIGTGFFPSMERFLDLPRKAELFAAVYRMRKTVWEPGECAKLP
ncbi:MAG: ABC-ATPase domain-containing protein [Defluviitaleaceae bacterium]|nr:ABC-ATPase domain-containing protein [Defluviitaleaceae bacterium]